MADAHLYGTLDRQRGISLDEMCTLLGAERIEDGTTAMPDEITLSVSVKRGEASISAIAGVPATCRDARDFPSLGFIVTAVEAADADDALEWLRKRCKSVAIKVRVSEQCLTNARRRP